MKELIDLYDTKHTACVEKRQTWVKNNKVCEGDLHKGVQLYGELPL